MTTNLEKTQDVLSFWNTLEYETPPSKFTVDYGLEAVTGQHGNNAAYLVQTSSGVGMDIFLKRKEGEHEINAYIFVNDTTGGFVKMREDLPFDGVVLVCEDLEASASLAKLTGRQVVWSLFAENTRPVAESLARTHDTAEVITFEDQAATAEPKDFAVIGNPSTKSLLEKIATRPEQVLEKIEQALAAESLRKQELKAVSENKLSDPKRKAALSAESLALKAQKIINQCVSMEDSGALIVTMYIFFTHLIDAFKHAPLLCLTSPVKRCGKSTTLRLCERFFWNVKSFKGATKASLEVIADSKCTIMIDEFDEALKNNPGVIGVINGGIEVGAKVTLVGKDGALRERSTFGAKVIAQIGLPPTTILDRSVVASMRRRKKGEKKLLKSEDIETTIAYVKREIEQWCKENSTRVSVKRVAPLEVENDRYRDNYEPLLKIAACISEDVEKAVRNAAISLLNSQREEDSGGEKLLADTKAAFATSKESVFGSNQLISMLCDNEDSIWRRYNNRSPISAVELASELRPFGIFPKPIRPGGGKQIRGYKRKDFDDAFERYVADATPLVPE